MKVRTVILAGFCEAPAKAQKATFLKLWRRVKETDAQWKKRSRDYQRQWRKANPEKHAEQLKRYREKHREDLRAYQRAYYHEHRKHLTEYKAAWARKKTERMNDRRRTKSEAGTQTEGAARSLEALVFEPQGSCLPPEAKREEGVEA